MRPTRTCWASSRCFDAVDAAHDSDRKRIAELDCGRSLCFDHTDTQLIGGLLQMVKGQIG